MGDLQKDLLKWSIENSKLDVDQEEEPIKFRKPQEIGKEWYDAIFGRPDVVVMKEQLSKLDDSDISEEDAVDALENLSFYVELTFNANDFAKIGGIPYLVRLVHDERPQVRLHTCWVIAKCSSNNQEFQEKFIKEEECFKYLLSMTQTDSDNQVRVKAFHAVSSLVRTFKEGVSLLMACDGLSVFLSLLESDDIRMLRRVTFTLKYLLFSEVGEPFNLGIPQKLLELGLIDHLKRLLENEDFELSENIIECVKEILEFDPSLSQSLSVLKDLLLDAQSREEDEEFKSSISDILEKIKQ